MSIFQGRKSESGWSRRNSRAMTRISLGAEGLERRELLAADALSISASGVVNTLAFLGSTDDIALAISNDQIGGGTESYTFHDDIDVINVTNTAPGVTVAGAGTATVTVSGLTTGSTNLSYAQGGAASLVSVQSVSDPLSINNTVTGGLTTVLFGDTSGSAQGVTAGVTVTNVGSTTALTVDDSGDVNPTDPTISPTAVDGITAGAIDLAAATLASLTLNGGSGDNEFTINGTPGNVTTTINTGSGSNGTSVNSTTPGATLLINPEGFSENVMFGEGETNLLGGFAQVNSPSGNGFLSISVDDASDTNPVSATLASATAGTGLLTGFGAGGIVYPVNVQTNLSVVAGTGGNTMTVDFDTNNPLPSGPIGGFNYQGGGTDTLVLTGVPTVAFTTEEYDAAASGILFNDGSFLTFSGLAPVIDTVPVAVYNFTPTSTAQVVDLSDGAVVGGAQTLLIASGDAVPAFERVSVANKGTVTDDEATAIGETTVLDVPTGPTGLTTLAVLGGTGDDVTRVIATPANVATSVSLGGGSDIIQLALSGVAPAPASLSLDGGSGLNTVDIDGGGGTLSTPPITGMPSTVAVTGGAPVSLDNFSTVNIYDITGATLTASSPRTLPFVAGANQSGVTVGQFTSSVTNIPPGEFATMINWGDGSPATVGTVVVESPGVYVVLGSHTYAVTGTYTLSVVVKDLGGSVTTTSGGVTSTVTYGPGATLTLPATADVSSASAIATISPVSPITGVVEGTPLTNVLVATFTTSSATATVGLYTATIDWGDGTPATAGSLILVSTGVGSLTFGVTGTHTYASSATVAKIHVAVYDQNGHQAGTVTTVAGIADAALTLGLSESIPAVSGAGLFGVTVATFVDPNTLGNVAQLSANIDWGDGSSEPGTIVLIGGTAAGLQYKVEGNHRYSTQLPIIVPILVSINDLGGRTLTVDSTAIVSLARVTGQPITVTGVEGLPLPITTSNPFAASTLLATFTTDDPTQAVADFSARVDFGDGSPAVQATVVARNTGAATEYEVYGGHTYDKPGTYAVNVTVNQILPDVLPAGFGPLFVTFTSTAVIADAPLTAVTPAPTVSATENTPLSAALASFTDGDPASTPSEFTATIDWGDGTPQSYGTITQPGGVGTAFVVTAMHNYPDSGVNGGFGSYPILIHITDVDGAKLNVVNTASVADVPITLNGQLNPTSDTGESNSDGITRTVTPDFYGTSEPGSTIKLYAYPNDGSPSFLIGQGVTSAAGVWNITAERLADGSYAVAALATDRFGRTTAAAKVATASDGGPLVIDTVGPQVEDVEFDRLTGQIVVAFQDDRSGLNVSTLVNASNYGLTKANTLPATYLFTGLTPDVIGGATAPIYVLATINGGRQLRGGRYVLTVHSGGVTDVAGNALDGEYYGTFPSGNRVPGGDFVSKLNAIHTIIFPPGTTVGTASPVGTGRVPVTRHIPASNPTDTSVATRAGKSAVTVHHVATKATTAKAKVAAKKVAHPKAVHDAALARVTVPKARRR